MSATISQARDQMCAVLKDALTAASEPYKSLLVLWPDVDGDPPKDVSVSWMRLTIAHATGGAASLGSPNGLKRWRRDGVLAVQVFTPVGDGLVTSDALMDIIMVAYEKGSTANGVWFRNVRLKEIGSSAGWQQVNVLADFEYDTVR